MKKKSIPIRGHRDILLLSRNFNLNDCDSESTPRKWKIVVVPCALNHLLWNQMKNKDMKPFDHHINWLNRISEPSTRSNWMWSLLESLAYSWQCQRNGPKIFFFFSGPITPLMAVINSSSREKIQTSRCTTTWAPDPMISGVVITPLCLYVYNPSDPSARPFLKGLSL